MIHLPELHSFSASPFHYAALLRLLLKNNVETRNSSKGRRDGRLEADLWLVEIRSEEEELIGPSPYFPKNPKSGNAATPFLLARVNELTGGASLTANIALVKNNALVGAKIAVALAHLRQSTNNSFARSAL
uniref:Uncharacterized protein n=1 Tax=Ananas comosus var. bracteatus TaxID=296719 RepID=A0A6V7PXB5_ANACO|nr:unnamed protein product [Ananas comosus var. bracteatus]